MAQYTMVRISKIEWEKTWRRQLDYALDIMCDISKPAGGTIEEREKASLKWYDLQHKIREFSKWTFKNTTTYHYCIVFSAKSVAMLDEAITTAYNLAIAETASVEDTYVRDAAAAKRQYAKAQALKYLHNDNETFELPENGDLDAAVLNAAKEAGWGELQSNSRCKGLFGEILV